MRVIHSWLVRQDHEEVPGTFLCNWNLTQEHHEEGDLLVFIDPVSNETVAYQWGGLVRPGILEVRAEMRGKGIGRVLVEHRLAEAFEHDEDILYIQCKPSSSIPFWRRMGFNPLEGEHGKQYAYRIMPRALELPENGTAIRVEVQWYPEQRKWRPDTPPLAALSPTAIRTPDGEIYFADRVHCFDGGRDRYNNRENFGDVVMRVVVDGAEIYCDKAKYGEAQDLGLDHCSNGFYLDALYHRREASLLPA